MPERRRLPRWQINRPALLKLKQAVNESYCQIKDINSVGAQVVLQAKLPLDIVFKMSLRLSEDYSIEAKVWAAWHRVINGSNHYGLYFSEIKDADKDKINKFIGVFYPDDDPEKMIWLDTDESKKGKGGGEVDDHRIFERFRKEFSARFIGLDGKEGQAQTFDVSAKGLGLSTSHELESQANLEIWLNVPNSTDPLYTRGQVVWTKLAGQEGFRSGIELERADLMGISRLLRA
jgi:hypothetical protein